MKFTSFMKKYHVIPKLICLVVAFIVWLYVMEVDSPDYEFTFKDCPVTIVGTSVLDDNSLSVFSGTDATVDVTVRGQQSNIAKLSSSDIEITADASKIKEAGTHAVDLYIDLPAGLTLVDSTDDTINIYVDKRITVSVELRAKLSSYQLSSGFELGDVTADMSTVSITGAESIVSEVRYAVANVNLTDSILTESFIQSGNISLYDVNDNPVESKYIRLSQSTVNVNVPVLTSKEVKLKVSTKYGYYTPDNVGVSITPSTVIVKGDASKLKDLDSISVTSLNEKGISEDIKLSVDITTPDGVTLAQGQPETADVQLTFKNMTKKSLRVTNIKTNAGVGVDCELLTPSLTINIFGETEAVSKITADDITLTADLTGFTGGEAVAYPTVTVDIKKADGDIVYEIGSYSVQVNIK